MQEPKSKLCVTQKDEQRTLVAYFPFEKQLQEGTFWMRGYSISIRIIPAAFAYKLPTFESMYLELCRRKSSLRKVNLEQTSGSVCLIFLISKLLYTKAVFP